jgi:hypothetical protein
MKRGVTFITLSALVGILSGADSLPVVKLEKEGVFHEPAPGADLVRFEIPVPPERNFERIIVEVDVTHGGWRAQGGKKTNHAIFWLNRGRKWRGNVLAYVNVFGPTRPRVKMANNIGQSPGVMSAQTDDWKALPGHTYRFRYVYDTGQGRVELTVKEGGKVVATLRDKINGSPISGRAHNDPAPGGFFIVFGHSAGSPGPEVPTHGWTYANLKAVFQ